MTYTKPWLFLVILLTSHIQRYSFSMQLYASSCLWSCSPHIFWSQMPTVSVPIWGTPCTPKNRHPRFPTGNHQVLPNILHKASIDLHEEHQHDHWMFSIKNICIHHWCFKSRSPVDKELLKRSRTLLLHSDFSRWVLTYTASSVDTLGRWHMVHLLGFRWKKQL